MFKKTNKMNLKKRKKYFRFKYLIYVFIIYFAFAYTFYFSFKNNKDINNEKFINLLLQNGNANILYEYDLINMINDTVNYLLNIDFKKPNTILNNSILKSGLTKNEINIEHIDDYSNMEELKEISSYIEDPNPVDINNPIIYIYNSHQLENYNNENLEIYGITPNVLMASYILKEKLNKLGLSTIVETTNLADFLNVNGWDHSSSYKASRLLMLDNISKYDSLKYFIDIHRDSVPKSVSTVTIGNKSYAKILFVLGLEHSNYQANLDNMNKINTLAEKLSWIK